jgi:hypothetical protein
MSAPQPTVVADLEHAIRAGIVQRTAGRIRGLRIDVAADRVSVHGRVASFHLKQLALQGIVDVLGSVQVMRIDLDIDVEPIRLTADEAGRGSE